METGALLVKGREIARALKAISSETGKASSMRSKAGRFRLQKTVYLLRKLQYQPASKYPFNIYLNGPYSPDLAQVYYALQDEGLSAVPAASGIPKASIRLIAEALAGSDDFLEGLTTTIDGIGREGSSASALAWARKIKPHLNEPIWKEVRSFLANHPELT